MSFRPFDNLSQLLSVKRVDEGLRLVDQGRILDAAREFMLVPSSQARQHRRVADISAICYQAGKEHQAAERIVDAMASFKLCQELGGTKALLSERVRLLAGWSGAKARAAFNLEEDRRLLYAGGRWPDGCTTLYQCLRSKEVLVSPSKPITRHLAVSAWTALGRYQPWLQRPWTQIIRLYKETPSAALARAFGEAAYEHVRQQDWFAGIDVIVPIPPNPAKFATRGFAPTDLLAKELEQRCAIPVRHVLDRSVSVRDTQESDYAEVLKTYRADGKWQKTIAGTNVLLIEDIITRGKNINAGGTRLFELQAGGVYVLALARTQDS